MRERRGGGQGAGRFRERQGEPATVIFKGRGWRVWRARFFPKEVKEKVGDRPVSQGGERGRSERGLNEKRERSRRECVSHDSKVERRVESSKLLLKIAARTEKLRNSGMISAYS